MRTNITFTAVFAADEYEDESFYVQQSASPIYGRIIDTWGFEIGLPMLMSTRAEEASAVWDDSRAGGQP